MTDINYQPKFDTINGYPIKFLLSIAAICLEQNITPEEAIVIMKDANLLFDAIRKEQERIIEETIRGLLNNGRP